jgi:50S ribosomal protein L16 3-hydroxylase
MSLFTDLSTDSFLRDYWQQKPLVIRQSLPELIDLIDGNELAGLACEEEAESQIISGHGLNRDWQCQQGPFVEADFEALAKTNWTLLVQGLDQWIDEAHDILQSFDFLPRWRLEDIMASYAPMGGGVGPHFDYYDVFLIQVSGTRQWQLGQDCDEDTALQMNEHVKLLADFSTSETHELVPGDMLYIPAGTAHWGTALSDDCITLSVGFRAPSEKALLATSLEHLIDQFSDNERYQDTLESIDQHPAKINASVHQQLSAFIETLTPEVLQQSINKSFGELVTLPRHSPLDEVERVWTEAELSSFFEREQSLSFFQPPHSRLAFSREHLFVNGEAYKVGEIFARAVCDGQITQALLPDQLSLLVELLREGDVVLQVEG